MRLIISELFIWIYHKYEKEFLSKGRPLEVICIPDEEYCLPEFFIPDKKLMVKFAWTDRHNLLLESMMEVKEEILTF